MLTNKILMCFYRHPWPPFCSNITFEVWSSREDDDIIQHWANKGISNDDGYDEGRFVRIIYNSEVLRTPCSDANSGDHLCSMKAFKQMMSKFVVHEDYEDLCGGKGEWHSPSHAAKEGKNAVQGGAI